MTLYATEIEYDGAVTASEKGHRDLLASIGKAIRLRRVELDMKRSELAERAGLSYAYVAEIENGTKQASSKALWVLAKALGLEPHELMASAARLETPERTPAPAAPGPASLLGRMELPDAWSAASAALAAAAPRASWFHLPAIAATQGSPAGAPSAAAFADDSGAPSAPSGPADPPGLPDILARVESALQGLPDERAELALMLALDERRTRRIVREELSRQRPSG
jgi:transcriptional regulator with XRE-family HTH domain